MIIDNPDALQAVVEEAKPRETCKGTALRLVRDLKPMLLTYANEWKRLSDPVWDERYADLYRKPLADAHALAQSYERTHKDALAPTSDGASERKPRATARGAEHRAPGP
jgi:hypothetical protein